LEYAIRKVQEIKVGMNLNGAHQLQVYGDDVNLLGDNIKVKMYSYPHNRPCRPIEL
jgi:hypothetical protein